MEHHGLLLERMIRAKGYSITEFARKIKVNRWSVYNWLNQPILNLETFNSVKKALNSDRFANLPKSPKPFRGYGGSFICKISRTA
jgi:hypothetical protein